MLKSIVGTLGYILSHDQSRVLMVHRHKRKEDAHLGKYNGLGGKMMENEDVLSCLKREIYEEAGIECTDIALRGIINWTGFGPHEENWLGFIFLIRSFTGEPFKENSEGSLTWVPLNKLSELPLWEGDRHFLPLIFDLDPRPFYGYMPYKKDKMLSWSFHRC